MPPTAEATSNLTIAEITTNFLLENRGDNVVLCNYEFYEFTEKWLLGVFALPLIFIGLLSNAMSIIIFSHRYMRQQPINWYLLILAISDSVILISAFFVLSVPRFGEIIHFWDATFVRSFLTDIVIFSYNATPIMYALMTTAQTVSVWMTVAMSLHRFVGVCLPFKAPTMLDTKNVKRLIGSVLIASLMFNTTKFFEVYISKICFMTPINVELPVLSATSLRQNELYRKIFYEWAYTLIMFAIPFTILFVVNSMVIIAIHRSRKIHAKLNVYDDGTRKQELAKEITTSVMLVAIVLAFMTCNTLAFVVNIVEKLELHDLYIMFVPWSNMLVMTNASINICIYCMFSDRYKQLLCYYTKFLCCQKKNEGFQLIAGNFMTGTG
uniref:G-protein coupled receptors family 1 profile domain-containing protein n=1 Tax=Panagrolaimus sp. PS1159 TaxID=55785 RepID=A0AC35FGL4_9BILA